MTSLHTPVEDDEFELTLIGPGYGESAVLHGGDGRWLVVDSCVDSDGRPSPLRYLEGLGVDSAASVELVVATHWHDDHIRGMGSVVEACERAAFCCAGVLSRREFGALIEEWDLYRPSRLGSGTREFRRVLASLAERESRLQYAVAGRLLLSNDHLQVRALSPSRAAFQHFLDSIGNLLQRSARSVGQTPFLSPNQASVVLSVQAGDVAVLLGSDLPRAGWADILDGRAREAMKAVIFKVPHHGSPDADEPNVWHEMLANPNPYAVLTPWRRGGRTRPAPEDADRLLARTSNAYATSKSSAGRRIRPAGLPEDFPAAASLVEVRSDPHPGLIRCRKRAGADQRWRVQMFGDACHLSNYLKTINHD